MDTDQSAWLISGLALALISLHGHWSVCLVDLVTTKALISPPGWSRGTTIKGLYQWTYLISGATNAFISLPGWSLDQQMPLSACLVNLRNNKGPYQPAWLISGTTKVFINLPGWSQEQKGPYQLAWMITAATDPYQSARLVTKTTEAFISLPGWS